jgi:hypothetical protein
MELEDVPAMVARIKRERPKEPNTTNCIDFALGDSGMGVRVIITYDERWLVSTSIGWITQDDYTPMDLEQWTAPLRRAATSCINEVLDCFDIDQDSKQARRGQTVVLFNFEEVA